MPGSSSRFGSAIKYSSAQSAASSASVLSGTRAEILMCFLGLDADAWAAIGSMATAGGTLAAAAGLFYAWRGIRQNTRAMELQVLESVFRDVRELDREYIADFDAWEHPQKNAWSASFFNTVEYLCFMVNQRITQDKTLRAFFFTDALPAWQKMFADHVKLGLIRDAEDAFPEFKRACKHIPPPKIKGR